MIFWFLKDGMFDACFSLDLEKTSQLSRVKQFNKGWNIADIRTTTTDLLATTNLLFWVMILRTGSHRLDIQQILVRSNVTSAGWPISVNWLAWFVFCIATKKKKSTRCKSSQHPVHFPVSSFSLLLQGLPAEAARDGDCKYQTCLIFTIQHQGGSGSIGSTKIIILTPHTKECLDK